MKDLVPQRALRNESFIILVKGWQKLMKDFCSIYKDFQRDFESHVQTAAV